MARRWLSRTPRWKVVKQAAMGEEPMTEEKMLLPAYEHGDKVVASSVHGGMMAERTTGLGGGLPSVRRMQWARSSWPV